MALARGYGSITRIALFTEFYLLQICDFEPVVFSAERVLKDDKLSDKGRINFNVISINRGYGMHGDFFRAPRDGDYRFSFTANSNDQSSYRPVLKSWYNEVRVYKNNKQFFSFWDRSIERANNIQYRPNKIT